MTKTYGRGLKPVRFQPPFNNFTVSFLLQLLVFAR